MATLQTSRQIVAGHSLFFVFQRAAQTLSNWNSSRKTRAALVKLSDFELEDIGLTRADIYRM